MSDKPRRSYGEGSLFTKVRNGKTYYIARLSVIEHGRRRMREAWCRDETAARKALRKLKQLRAQGKRIFGERISMRAYLSAWERDRVGSVAPQTAMHYERVLRLHMKQFLGPISLIDFSAADAAELYRLLRKRGRSSATIRRVHIILHKALTDAVREGRIDRNPLAGMEAPQHRSREVEPYSLEEIRAFLAAARGDRLEPLWVLAIFSQAREGELFALRWRDVDLKSGAIVVSRGLQDVTHSQRRVAHPKTPASRRRIELPPIAIESLRRAHQAAQRSPGYRETNLVFHDRRGGPLRRQNLLRRHLYPLMDRTRRCPHCGASWVQPNGRPMDRPDYCSAAPETLRRIHFHALRHSGATLLAELIPLVALKERLGHASIATTANVYVHRSPSLQRLAADRLAELFPVDDGENRGTALSGVAKAT